MVARPSTRNSSSGSATPSARAARSTSGTSGRAASNAVMVSRAAAPSGGRLRVGETHPAQRIVRIAPDQRAISAMASACLPSAASTWPDRSPDPRAPVPAQRRAQQRPRRARSPRARRRSTRASTLPPQRPAPSPGAPRGELAPVAAPGRASPRSSRTASRREGGGPPARQRLGPGVEVEPARRERPRQQQRRRPPARGGARRFPGRVDRVARAIGLEGDRRQLVPGRARLGIDDRGAQRVSRPVLGEASGRVESSRAIAPASAWPSANRGRARKRSPAPAPVGRLAPGAA